MDRYKQKGGGGFENIWLLFVILYSLSGVFHEVLVIFLLNHRKKSFFC